MYNTKIMRNSIKDIVKYLSETCNLNPKQLVSVIAILLIATGFIVLYNISLNLDSEHKYRENFDIQSKRKFSLIQDTINPNRIFDLDILSDQVSQKDLDYFNTNNKWLWSETTKTMYLDAVNRNPMIRTYAPDSLNSAMRIYNEEAIKKILFNQSREGQAFLTGVPVDSRDGNKWEQMPNGIGDFGYDSGIIEDRTKDIVICGKDQKLSRIQYKGKGAIFGEQQTEISNLNYGDLENLIPGFTFLETPCDPCTNLFNNKLNTLCKFHFDK